jgi:hypothetical protein
MGEKYVIKVVVGLMLLGLSAVPAAAQYQKGFDPANIKAPPLLAPDTAKPPHTAKPTPDSAKPAPGTVKPVPDTTTPPDDAAGAIARHTKRPPFHWKPALKQSLLFLTFLRSVDLATEADTRRNLAGPFLKDYFRSVANTSGWADGDPFFTNYIAHPMMGAITGNIEVQNDPEGSRLAFSFSKRYFKSRLRAMAWSAAFSAQFELGPGISEAMIGNVGLPAKYRPPGTTPKPPNGGMGTVDLVMTPTIGTAWLIAEDMIDRYVIRRFEGRTHNLVLWVALRSLLNPARSSANIFRFQKPWRRDNRQVDISTSTIQP